MAHPGGRTDAALWNSRGMRRLRWARLLAGRAERLRAEGDQLGYVVHALLALAITSRGLRSGVA